MRGYSVMDWKPRIDALLGDFFRFITVEAEYDGLSKGANCICSSCNAVDERLVVLVLVLVLVEVVVIGVDDDDEKEEEEEVTELLKVGGARGGVRRSVSTSSYVNRIGRFSVVQ